MKIPERPTDERGGQRDIGTGAAPRCEFLPMKRKIYHAVIPTIMPATFFLIAATPVETLGCLVRGLLASMVALASGLGALATASMGVRGRIRGDTYSPWWIISTLVLTIPVVALLILA
ncbi:MAG: hypothetical protein LUP91_16305 [Methylococcaceae bacterium]|nr:hypothetical protein [Methylococcaceae bacterium]